MTTIQDLKAAALAATLDIEQLKAAAKVAIPYPAGNELLECDHCIEKFHAIANPATILALLERLQVAEDAAKDAEQQATLLAVVRKVIDMVLKYPFSPLGEREKCLFAAIAALEAIAARRLI